MITLSFSKKNPYSLAVTSGLFLVLMATGYHSAMAANSPIKNSDTALFIKADNGQKVDNHQKTLRQQALDIQRALSTGNYAEITKDIHPTRGVRFSMYGRVLPESDKVFSREQFTQYLRESRIRFTWGEKDGVGDSLVISLPEYLQTWVAAKDFDNTSIGINELDQYGVYTIKNIQTIYPSSDVVEFYYEGSGEYDGMDWRALRLVFEEYQGQRYLVAIVNDQWTI